MAERITVQCLECGRAFTARRVGDEIVLTTDSGDCVCGDETFTEFEDVTDSPGETMG